MSQNAVEHYISEHARIASLDTDWLHSVRQSAISNFRQTGFPTLRHENWKYTDVRPILKRNFVQADPQTAGFDPGYINSIRFAEMECHDVVFTNGSYAGEFNSVKDLPAGALVQSLAEALIRNTDKVKECLGQFGQEEENGFAVLNTAFLTNGMLLYVPDDTVVEMPVNLMYLAGDQSQPHVSHLRNLVILGRNARLTLIENYVGKDGSEYLTNTVTNIVAGQGAILEHYKLQQESMKAFHIGNLRTYQQRDSRIESHSFSLGGALVRNDINSSLAEEGAEIMLNGLYIANGKQHVDNHTWINHLKPRTVSRENYRGVLDGHARGVFNGKVVVHKHAQKTDARQSNANLLLSDHAEIDTKPELEIYADDVKCSHGATIGQLDENMLFYLRTRAIDAATAKSLLTFAFADEVITGIKFLPIRTRLESTVVGKLPDSGLIRDFMG
jgi:Fe-S cluster assembly protein SufD